VVTGDIGWLAATELVRRVREGTLSPQEVVDCHLQRISRLDGRTHAFVHVDRDAEAGTGPLAGVTVGVKDTDPVAGMPWTSGSCRWRDRVAEVDSLAVAAARRAGATILGKLNTPELAAAVSTFNELFPATENPWREGYTPGGSSGGSGAAVAAGLCTIAYGGDMGGSIRIPAACCGVFGLRPSPFRVPSEAPEGTRLAVRGPLARSAADLRLAFELMSGVAAPPPGSEPLRVLVVDESPVPVDPACAAARDRAAEALARAGHHVSRGGRWDPMPVARAYQRVRPVTMATVPGEPGEYGAAVRDQIAGGRRTGAVEFLAALEAGVGAATPVLEQLDGHDVLLTPALGRLPMPIGEVPPFLSEAWSSYTQFMLPVSFSGAPAVAVPAGLQDDLPVAVQLVGRWHQEWTLLDLAEELSGREGFGFQRPPAFA
jgi:amidase